MKITASSPILYTANDVYALDAAAIAGGIPAIQLMKRAGRAAFELLLERFPAPELISIYCGAGNNGGDGYVLAALAAQRLLPVQVIQLTAPDKLSGEARQAYDFALQEGVAMVPFVQAAAPTSGVIVDALLGIGLRGAPSGEFAAAIEQINHSCLPVLALDIPSGLNADTGAVAGVAVAAKLTITFIAIKRGLLTGRGAALTGELVLANLDVPAVTYDAITSDVERLSLNTLIDLLPARAADAHKGDFGHVMVIGGDTGYGGAALMAAEAAARSGAGKVSVATRPEHVAAILARRPEVMACGVVSGQELEPLLAQPTLLVVGPGLGRTPWSEQMLQQAIKSGLPLVLDADALNILAEGRVVPAAAQQQHRPWLLTPHPAEAARLLGITTAEVQADRFAAVRALSARYNASVILKGAGSLVAANDGVIGVVTDGNPGMASGGMGDVLSGIVGALIAQGLSSHDAARLGAVVHACAADLAAEDLGQRSLLATDLIPYLGQLL
ncbi:bifunctional ADP-dependent NAD(P)H-hydrate dehydratase/NAD(P)H-hydrate epimerase [Cellvibrio sp. OA-2007]|uniref:bifunctional ADP-dependent NAD(P)H-hydrate dehydratase/NAD(P)H-hydrate epimerase n=1 Tax=Cellvibrio sp. OA-2007 TaxID=529823 RepID=UPI000782C585|nr:bifunctional ADP-dependent NAD(P)H-hydrate dehydratase/NAD(P)H-hydrate epimerase [Cellvibrio sp. OA-2007]